MADEGRAGARRHVLEVAAEILERDGSRALSTRSVAAAAGIRAASLYQHFGDKDGLLAALAVHAFELYLTDKHTIALTGDPVTDMRRGWDTHVEFGLRHPALYVLMYGTDRPDRPPPAADEARKQLMTFLHAVADAGRLRVRPALAASVLLAANTGVTLTLIATGPGDRDLELSTRLRDTVIDSLTTDPPHDASVSGEVAPSAGPDIASRAMGLDAAITSADDEALPLRPTETALLRDWLHQLAR